MDNNHVLVRLRYAMNLPDRRVAELTRSAGVELAESDVARMLRDEGAEDFLHCPNRVLGAFLDAVILERRGPPDPASPHRFNNALLTNNEILKKIRVAFSLTEADVEDALAQGGMRISKAEIRALFRRPDQANYRECGDQVMRKFLAGFTRKLRV